MNAITIAQNEATALAQTETENENELAQALEQSENENELAQALEQSENENELAQAEFEAELKKHPILFNIDDLVKFTELAKELSLKKRSVSLVTKSYMFTTSAEMVAQNAAKLKGKEGELYYEQNIGFASVVGYFQGSFERMANGKRSCQTMWANEEGSSVNFGVQLARATANIPIGTPIEIVYLRDEACKGSAGTVKIYDIFLLV